MAFFRNFPLINYKFGDEIDPAAFQNLSVYVDLIDQIVNDASFYETYTIIDGERPDTLSQKLYDTTDFYWTFYLLNDKLRRQGWPLTYQEVYSKSKLYYPNQVVTTEDVISDRMFRGDIVYQGSASNPTAIGIIQEKNLDLGKIVIKPVLEVRSINVTNAGAGYTQTPNITIFDEHGNRHEEIIVAATGVAAVSSGTVSSIAVSKGGSGYEHAPTVTIDDPLVVDFEQVASDIDIIVAGLAERPRWFLDATTTIPSDITDLIDSDGLSASFKATAYYSLLTEIFDGFQRGDVTRTGQIDAADAAAIRSYYGAPDTYAAANPTIAARIRLGLRQPILNNESEYPLYVPFGSTRTIATATALLSSSTFNSSLPLITATGVTDWRDINITNQKSIALKSTGVQYDAVHHYENSSGEWVDIDPFDQTSAAAYTPVTYLERIEKQNEALKEINVLKPDVAIQIYGEFQRLLRER
jgi:hypothetical protein